MNPQLPVQPPEDEWRNAEPLPPSDPAATAAFVKAFKNHGVADVTDAPVADAHREKDVSEELERLRVRHAARQRFDAEQRPPLELPPLFSLRERLALPRPPVRWRITGWQPEGSRVILGAQYKAGKTTAVGNLVRSLADGDPFLNHAAVTPAAVIGVIDVEMSERQLDDWLRDQQIVADDRIILAALRGRASTFNILDDKTRAKWADRLTGCEYLILDPLRPVLDALGLNEHSEAGVFLQAFDALLVEAKVPNALLVHHFGHGPERSRGDSRLRDWPDVEWRLVRENDEPGSPRYISGFGRDVDIGESALHYDPATRHLTLAGGSRRDAAALAALKAIEELLAAHSEPLSTSAIEKELDKTTDHSRSAIRSALKLGVGDTISRTSGPRGAHLHTLTSPPRRTSPPPRRRTVSDLASSPIERRGHSEVENPSTPPERSPLAAMTKRVAPNTPASDHERLTIAFNHTEATQ